MQIICSKPELLKGIQTVQSAVSTKGTLPVLSNILLETSANQLKLAATDLEVGIKCFIKAEIVKEGSLTIPAKMFSDFIRTLWDDQEIKIVVDEAAKMEIRCGKARCVLSGLSKEEFPVLPDFQEDKAISIEVKILQEMIKKTVFSVSTDETRYILNGVYFILDKGVVKMVATDGRRLAFISRPVKENKAAFTVIIPSKAIKEVERLLTAESENTEVKISITENQVAFKIKETVIISRLIEGNFPNYEQVIPKQSGIKIKLATRDLLATTQRAALGCGDRGGAIKFILEKGRMRAIGAAQGRVEVEDELPVDYAGQLLEIAFNPAFVLDVLKNTENAEIVMEFSSALNPGVIRPSGDDQALSVIMPMRA
jgi:DNA polymerase-3 subunit beta